MSTQPDDEMAISTAPGDQRQPPNAAKRPRPTDPFQIDDEDRRLIAAAQLQHKQADQDPKRPAGTEPKAARPVNAHQSKPGNKTYQGLTWFNVTPVKDWQKTEGASAIMLKLASDDIMTALLLRALDLQDEDESFPDSFEMTGHDLQPHPDDPLGIKGEKVIPVMSTSLKSVAHVKTLIAAGPILVQPKETPDDSNEGIPYGIVRSGQQPRMAQAFFQMNGFWFEGFFNTIPFNPDKELIRAAIARDTRGTIEVNRISFPSGLVANGQSYRAVAGKAKKCLVRAECLGNPVLPLAFALSAT